MSRRSIKKTTQPPNSYSKNIPKISIRPGENLKITTNPRHKHQKINITRNFKKKTPQVSKPINFLNTEFVKTNTDICFVVGGGPSLNGFDFKA